MTSYGKLLLVLLLAVPVAVSAQPAASQSPQDSQQTPASQASPASQGQTGQARPADALLKPEQLEALVAPIALYPDDLLANVLAASTYPLGVVQADRWLTQHKNLKGDALKKDVDKQGWDDSVKALVGTASVLSMMSEKVDWTKNLGDAVLAQQSDVMDAIQRLRSKAYDNKKLTTTKQQKVSVETQAGKQVVVIESAEPNTMYVPYYDPAVVYGQWPYTEYPPYYFAAPPYIGAGLIATGLAFGAGWALARWGNYWGGGVNWGNRNLYVNHYNRVSNVGNNWQHNPAHRQGVRYSNTNVQQRFGNNSLKAGAANRMDFRGREGQQVLRPGQDRAGGGDRTGNRAASRETSRNRPGGGERGSRPSTTNRAKGGGERAKAANRTGGAARGGSGRDTAFRNVSSGRVANLQSARGHASLAGRGGGAASFAGRGGGPAFRGGGGGGFRGGGGGFRGGGGGRRSDIALKHDIVLLGHLANGLGYYRFSYLGSSKSYVGVMAQDVLAVMPEAVTRGSDGYLRVDYEKLGLKFRTYGRWLATGAGIPHISETSR